MDIDPSSVLHAIKWILEILLRFETTAKNVKKSRKNRVKISRFLTPPKIREGMGEILAVLIEFNLDPNMWYNFYDALLGSLGD